MATAVKNRARLGDLLIARGIITEAQLATALETQRGGQQQRLVGEILVDLGYASKEQILAAVAEACGVPFAHLLPQLVDAAVRGSLPETFIQKHGVLPLFRVRDVLTVAVSEPSNQFLADEIAHAANTSIQVVAATADNIYQMIEQTAPEEKPALRDAEVVDEPAPTADVLMPDDYDSVYGEWSPDKVAALLMREAVRLQAGAIHVEPDEKVLRIRFSIDGALHVVMRPPARMAATLAAAFEAMVDRPGGEDPAGDLRPAGRLVVHGKAVQLHRAAMGGAFGPRLVIRIVRDDEATRPLDKLGADFELLGRYRQLVAGLRGLVVVAGPRASGLTTTLYGTLNELDPIRLNLCTLESQINFNLPGVNQFSPATCGAADAPTALARLLQQQPDVLVLDVDLSEAMAAAAVEAAMDTRLVLAQVRAADSADAIARLSALAPAEGLATVLRGVMAQRLVRTICPQCRAACEPPAHLRRRIAAAFGPVESYVKGRGCASCSRTGLAGRIGLFELAPIDGGMADLIRHRADRQAIRYAIRAAQRPSLWVDGINKVRAGITSIDEILAVLADCPGETGTAGPADAAQRPA